MEQLAETDEPTETHDESLKTFYKKSYRKNHFVQIPKNMCYYRLKKRKTPAAVANAYSLYTRSGVHNIINPRLIIDESVSQKGNFIW